jgi:hypothetical protein
MRKFKGSKHDSEVWRLRLGNDLIGGGPYEKRLHFYVARRDDDLGFAVNQQIAHKGCVDKIQIE